MHKWILIHYYSRNIVENSLLQPCSYYVGDVTAVGTESNTMEMAEPTPQSEVVSRIVTGSCDGTTKVWNISGNSGKKAKSIDLAYTSERENVGVTSIATTEVCL